MKGKKFGVNWRQKDWELWQKENSVSITYPQCCWIMNFLSKIKPSLSGKFNYDRHFVNVNFLFLTFEVRRKMPGVWHWDLSSQIFDLLNLCWCGVVSSFLDELYWYGCRFSKPKVSTRRVFLTITSIRHQPL